MPHVFVILSFTFNCAYLFIIVSYVLLFQVQGPHLLGLQASMSQLIYRYLASEEGSESADRKTRLLLTLVQHIHTAAHIMQHRTRSNQLGNTTSASPHTSVLD